MRQGGNRTRDVTRTTFGWFTGTVVSRARPCYTDIHTQIYTYVEIWNIRILLVKTISTVYASCLNSVHERFALQWLAHAATFPGILYMVNDQDTCLKFRRPVRASCRDDCTALSTLHARQVDRGHACWRRGVWVYNVWSWKWFVLWTATASGWNPILSAVYVDDALFALPWEGAIVA